MPIVSILKYILGGEEPDTARNDLIYEDNEILFCKNNVCVHPPALVREETDVLHYPGYLTLSTKTFVDQYNNSKRPTLFLTWIPNSTLRKCPSTIENSPSHQNYGQKTSTAIALRKQVSLNSKEHEQLKEELHNFIQNGTNSNIQIQMVNTNPFIDPYVEPETLLQQPLNADSKSMNFSDYSETISIGSNSDKASVSLDCGYSGSQTVANCQNGLSTSYIEEDEGINENDHVENEGNERSTNAEHPSNKEEDQEHLDLKAELEPLLEDDTCDDVFEAKDTSRKASLTSIHSKSSTAQLLKTLKHQPSVTSVNITISNPQIENSDVSAPDAQVETELIEQTSKEFIRTVSITSQEETNPFASWMSPETFAYKHNLSFPESVSASPIVSRKHAAPLKCRRFSVDLSQMRALRLFFNDENCTSGQLVIASRESQYKILHFHHGGLDHLAQVLHQWHCLLHNIKLAPGQDEPNLPYRQFMVCRPEVRKNELHPEEGKVNKITTDYFYGTLLNDKGQIEDDLLLRKCVFFGGLEKNLRKTVWPFLLHCYSTNSTFNDRAALSELRKQEYEEITRRRLYQMSPEEQAHFWRSVQSVIEKDVVRTDRANPFFAGEGNTNIDTMKNILLNYAYYNPGMSYTQGMSDLLAPVLCEINSESETFWCFVGLMQRAIFVATPTDNDIDRNLCYLRELIRLMVPKFYEHLEVHSDASELLFCHRWILLCFKREFTEAVAIRMWEACWSNFLTDYFHLFLCLAIIAVYADDVIAQNLRTDEMLLHFSSLAMYMDGQLILRKARGLLHQFRQFPKIPCTLSGLCKRCGPGMWDSAHHPSIECVGHMDNERCALADN